jgi:transcriptional regulator with PAS, ATPase and Fis domain
MTAYIERADAEDAGGAPTSATRQVVITDPSGRERRVDLDRRLTTIGKSPSSHIRLDDGGVARHHACILFALGRYQIKNLGPPKAVTCNGEPVSQAREILPGDIVRIQGYRLELARDELGGDAGADVFGKLDHERMLRLLSGLVEAVSELLRERTERQALVRLVGAAARLMRCDGVRLLMLSEDHQSVETLAAFPETAPDHRFSRTALQWADEEGRTVVVADMSANETLAREQSIVINEIRSVLCSPLRSPSGIRGGYLYLDRLKGHPPFGELDRELFERLRELFGALVNTIRQREQQARMIRELEEQAVRRARGSLIFESESMRTTVAQASRVARTRAPVLVAGETGSGKEVLARFIHETSDRADKPFIAVNCGAIPENLMESEFFGYQKGAFTGASSAKSGHFVMADTGTLFLDEISELPLGLQVKLLRVLQQQEVTPVGASTPIPVDTRIVAATNRDLEQEVAAGRFRQDLFFRLNVVTIRLPALRDRERDVILLANHFLREYARAYSMETRRLSSAAEKAMVLYRWPGNVRELENRMQRAVILSPKTAIEPEALSLPAADPAEAGEVETMESLREKAELHGINRAMATARGNISLAAKLLALDRKVFTRLLRKYDIDAQAFRRDPADT